MENRFITLFKRVEEGLQRQLGLSDEAFAKRFAPYRNLEFEPRSDNAYFQILKETVFYSGFSAMKVKAKLASINHWLPDYRRVAGYDDRKIAEILADSAMLKNEAKVKGVVVNARIMEEIVEKDGSFHAYLLQFDPRVSLENLLVLKEEMEHRFAYLGGITAYHFLMEMGLNVLKPDRVIVRIFKRLGLIDHEEQFLKAILAGRRMAAENEVSIRYVDILFVTYGQEGPGGVCLLTKPGCSGCLLAAVCQYPGANR